jgi:uncharacterized protein (TIGR02145 family)
MKKICTIIFFLSTFSSGFIACNKTNNLPVCTILSPVNDTIITQGEMVEISVAASKLGGIIQEVRFFINHKGVSSSKHFPYTYNWNTTGRISSTYNIMAVAIDDDGITDSTEVNIFLSEGGETGTVVDFEGNSYKTVKIGNQWWMAENLKTAFFPDSTRITLADNSITWDILPKNAKAFCYYNFNTGNESETFGALYTWTAATNGKMNNVNIIKGPQGVCPSGWHLPSDLEWKQLEMNLGMDHYEVNGTGFRGTDEGAKLKKSDPLIWNYPSLPETNKSGFSAVPGGHCYPLTLFEDSGFRAYFWTSSGASNRAWYRCLNRQVESVYRNTQDIKNGYSVRCVRD